MTKLHISSTVLAALLYECANATTDIEGFLLGAKATRSMPLMEDSSDNAVHDSEALLFVHAYHCLSTEWPRFYDHSGNVQVDLLQQHLQHIPPDNSIIGFFRSRRQSTLALSVREQLLIKAFGECFEQFSCIAIVSTALATEDDLSTHAYDYAFWSASDPGQRTALHIANMGESTLAYRHFLSTAPVASSPRLRHIKSFVSKAIEEKEGDTLIDRYNDVYNTSMESLLAVSHSVARKEAELNRLKDEIKCLEESIHSM